MEICGACGHLQFQHQGGKCGAQECRCGLPVTGTGRMAIPRVTGARHAASQKMLADTAGRARIDQRELDEQAAREAAADAE